MLTPGQTPSISHLLTHSFPPKTLSTKYYTISSSQMKKMKEREVKKLPHGHPGHRLEPGFERRLSGVRVHDLREPQHLALDPH